MPKVRGGMIYDLRFMRVERKGRRREAAAVWVKMGLTPVLRSCEKIDEKLKIRNALIDNQRLTEANFSDFHFFHTF